MTHLIKKCAQSFCSCIPSVSKGEGEIRPFCQKARRISGHLFTLAQCLCVRPCSKSHPLLCLSVYTAVYCGSARGKKENCCSIKANAI